MFQCIKKSVFLLILFLPLGGFFLYQNFLTDLRQEGPIGAEENSAASTPETKAVPTEANYFPVSEEVVTKDVEKIQTAQKYPAQIINLSNWKQTLPLGSSGKPLEIKPESLATYSREGCFQANSSGDGVVFRAPVNGVTTKGSGYPRSELRELSQDGKSLAGWSTSSGRSEMTIEQAITAVPKNKKHVVAGQIHDSEDDVIVIRLEYPKLFVDINGKEGPTLDPNYVLGKKFTVKFVAEKGKIMVYYNGGNSPTYTLDKKLSGCYFKAGAYTQSNCSKESDCSEKNYGEVTIYKLDVKHLS